MTLNAGLVSILLVLSAIQGLVTTTEHPTTETGENTQCELDLHTLTANEIEGIFEADDNLKITFHALLKGDTMQYNSSVVDPSDPDTSLAVQLSLPQLEDRVVSEIENHVVEIAGRLAESTACNIPDGLNNAFKDLATELHRCTESMGISQLRFSALYQETIVASAKRICNGAETICSASPVYIYGNGPFICQEDFEELFPDLMEEAKIKMVEIKKTAAEISEISDKQSNPLCHISGCDGMEGSDWGCCGNYPGCCMFCSPICYIHDKICTCCHDLVFCLPGCKPDPHCEK